MFLSIYSHIRKGFTLDTRSLALFRISFSAIVIYDLLVRFTQISHYTDPGAISRKFILENYSIPYQYRLFFLDGSSLFVALLLIITLLCFVALLIGYRTRLFTILCFILIVSLQRRNPTILYDADVIIRTMLFWCMFVPLGRALSVENMLQQVKRYKSYLYFSIGGVGLIFQIISVYFFAALSKSGIDWYNGSAVYYALHVPFTTGFGKFLLNFPFLVSLSTYLVFFIELLSPILLVTSAYKERIRLFAIFLLTAIQVIFALSFNLGIFPWISIAVLFALIPSTVWDSNAFNWLLTAMKKNNTYKFQTLKYIFRRIDSHTPHLLNHESKLLSAVYIPYILVISMLIVFTFTLNLYRASALQCTTCTIPTPITTTARELGIDQRWSMFAPHPPHQTGELIIKGIDNNTHQVLLPTYSHYSSTNYRNVNMHHNLNIGTNYFYKEQLAQYYCSQNPNISTLEINLMLKNNDPQAAYQSASKTLPILTYQCVRK